MLKYQNGSRILFTGDSITDAGRGRPVGEGLWEGVGTGFVRTVDNLLNVWYPEYTFRVTNTGTSGDNSRTLLARWDSEVLALAPDYLYFEIGINDVWRQFDSPGITELDITPEEYRSNLRELLGRAKSAVRKETVTMTPYYMEPCKGDIMRARMDEYGAIIKEVSAEYGVVCLDLQKEFDEYLKHRHSSFIVWDRVHPGNIGGTVIARAILREAGFDKKF